MKVLIEQYRNHEIYFDTEEQTFIAMSDVYDRQKEKKSFASAKKEIDDYIKDNVKFKPVWVEKEASRWFGGERKIKIIGIRKDGKFIYESKGKSVQLSEYGQGDWYLCSEINDKIYSEINMLEDKIEVINEQIKKLKTGIIKEDLGLENLKAQYTI